MIDLKAQLYWARVKRWVTSGAFALGFNFTKYTARKRKLSLLMRTIPDAQLKKPPPKKGWRLFWVMHQDLQGTRHALRKADI
jgi:hypothetical protein